MRWAKSLPPARINLARSGVELCPASVLGAGPRDVVIQHPPGYGWPPLKEALGRRYRVSPEWVYPVSGGTSFATWLACVAALDGGGRGGGEVIVERPTYEHLLRIPQALGCRVRRLERRFGDGYAIDLERFASRINRRTRLAIVSNLHNPSGARIDLATLRAMARMLRSVGAWLLVDEVYLECLFGRRTDSSVHAGPNVIATNSLTKAYGLDGLRAGWILGPRALIARAGRANDLMTVNGVAPGEHLSLLALRRLGTVRRRADGFLLGGLGRVRRFLVREPRLQAVMPPGGNVVFPRLPRGVDADRLHRHLLREYSTLVVPGRMFEAPRHIRISFGLRPGRLASGLRNISRALDDLGAEAE